ncbi:conserved hypothetical protein (plasmid) [Deferribacter desulfuricans SSM1]|uniref:EcsC family protein n=1 Tax=Deferribacter desulfuricans (strain DSM 14783 / JCM 11476 / NBRC 101012 / SSM1) TaxID=639282 RepID=D3PEL9_DEFDS|nr:EcsC family protein [Deferribacter desulfuricans]BAI81661.1 conserved hypothetical protein [Deferribacter desulfuricans SSM1]
MSEKESVLTTSIIMDALEWAYEKSLNPGIAGLDSAYELAESYLKEKGTLEEKVDSLIRWQIAKAGTAGFITGLGGVLTLPATIPANLASVYFIHIRMVAAIAIMGGYDLKDDKVQSLVFACLCGNAFLEVLRQAGIRIGNKIAEKVVIKISGDVIKDINKKVGFRLLTKFGEKGFINLGKAIPIVGGIVGGCVDAISTNAIGEAAKKVFITGKIE